MRSSRNKTSKIANKALGRILRGLCGLLVLWLVSAVSATGTLADEPGRAGIVVQLDDGRVEFRCVDLEEDVISGAELLARSGLDYIIDPASGMGLIVCQIEEVGCDHPTEPCFCQCMGGGECIYWNYFFKEPGEGDWTYSALGAAMHKVKAGSVDAWVWGDGHEPPASELDFEAICAAPTAVPSETPGPLPTAPPAPTFTLRATGAATTLATELNTATALPTATLPQGSAVAEGGAVAAASPSPASRATAAATALPPTANPTPTPASSQGLAGYWPFGLIVLGLAAAGAIVWLRRR